MAEDLSRTLRRYGGDLAQDTIKFAQWERMLTDIEAKLAANEPVYVSFRDDRREGSVGRIKSLDIDTQSHSTQPYSYSYRSSYGTAPRKDVRLVQEAIIGFDDRKNELKLSPWDFFLEPEHTGGTVYKWTQNTRPKAPKKIVKDRIGEPVNAGDFVAFVHRRYGNISLKFGTITRITDKGTVFVQTLKLKDGDRSEEERCNEDNIVIVNDQLMNRLVMAKLAAN